MISLALRGVNVHAGSFLKSTSTSTPVSQAVTGSNFTPSVVLLSSVQDVAQGSPVAETRFGLGAASATVEGSSAVADADAALVARYCEQALGEGFGDYWAAALTDDSFATVLGPACVASWDATAACSSRRAGSATIPLASGKRSSRRGPNTSPRNRRSGGRTG